jgi:predicted nuclease of predicted toxin-antitoxin system
MKFLCDVHISYKIVNYLIKLGFETIHVNTILKKWNTSDNDICKYADSHDHIVISKDSDFRDSYFVRKTPKKLIKINLGNISNQDLIDIFAKHIDAIEKLNYKSSFIIEIDKENISFITEF